MAESVTVIEEVRPVESSISPGAKAAATGGRVVVASMTVVVALIPAFAGTLVGQSVGSVFILLSQTFAKLTILSQFSFDLGENAWSTVYYMLFQEAVPGGFFGINLPVFNSEISDPNTEAVCEAGFKKFCWLGLEDNFWIANGQNWTQLIMFFFFYLVILNIVRLLRKPNMV